MVDRRKKMNREWLESPPKSLKKLLPTFIPYASVVEQMGLYQATVAAYAPRNLQAETFRRLWRAIHKRLGG